MKSLSKLFFLVLLASSCEYATLKYGYYWNPIKVLEEANLGIENNNLNQFSDVLSGKTLCIYGSREGMVNIRSALKKVDENSLSEPVLISAKHLSRPLYVGYFSYYQEIYESKATSASGQLLLKTTILCNFGTTEVNAKSLNASLSTYSTRSCSIVGIKNLVSPIKESDYCQN